jgi:hypothetical protein
MVHMLKQVQRTSLSTARIQTQKNSHATSLSAEHAYPAIRQATTLRLLLLPAFHAFPLYRSTQQQNGATPRISIAVCNTSCCSGAELNCTVAKTVKAHFTSSQGLAAS